mmetsp:Transcript_44356/g.70460  ORF Transcript_44356/g.70460 Transcript_44356/m.70460 type:complete len:281 (-) Transcript_44356:1201-2043(-)
MAGVVLQNDVRHVSDPPDTIKETASNIQPIVVPLISDGPHQNGRVILCLFDRGCGRVRICAAPVVDAVDHPNALAPKGVQHPLIRNGLICSHSVDSHRFHQLGILLHRRVEVQVCRVRTALGHRVPGHALQMQRGAIHQDLLSHHLNALVGPRRWRCSLCGRRWSRTLRWSISLAALAEDVRGTCDGLVARHFISHLAVLILLLSRPDTHLSKAFTVLVASAAVLLRQNQGHAVATGHAIVHVRPVLDVFTALFLRLRGPRPIAVRVVYSWFPSTAAEHI